MWDCCWTMKLFILFLTLLGFQVCPGWSVTDLLLQPLIELDQEQIDIEDYARARCESDSGRQCHFYIDQSPNPFRSTPHSFGVCQLTVYVSELLENKTRQDKMEIFLSCTVETLIGNQAVLSKRSGMKKLEVFDSLRIVVDTEHIKKETIVTIRCEARRGTRCHFYTDESRAPFRTVPFREEFKVCLLTVTGWELQGQRSKGTGTDVLMSCAAELTTEGRTVFSLSSRSIRIQVESPTEIEGFSPGFNYTEANSTLGYGQFPHILIWVAAGELFSLMATAVLSFLYFKHKRHNQEENEESAYPLPYANQQQEDAAEVHRNTYSIN
ncbi:uncharacterized protein [Lepisosteus oculatus]|uniref:uncharacterized protein isoform X2 n=1 Tax=Lepisosteus oculatus TaxID=7918 RepID=UPI0035F52DA2